MKMHSCLLGFLAFVCSIKGLTCSEWTIKVQSLVNGSLGQNVILPCHFTHPKQDTYNGIIIVKWIQENKDKPFFYCYLFNKTGKYNENCTEKSGRFSLHGSPQNGDLSLRINNLEFSDSLKYTCRVELDYNKIGNHMVLNVTGPAQILLLSQYLEDSLMLQCIAQGNPLPQVKWSSSGLVNTVKTFHHSYRIISSVQFSEQDVYTCHAVNSLGQAHRTFPAPNYPNPFSYLMVIGFLGGFLLLAIVAFILYVLGRRQSTLTSMPHHTGVQRIETSVYQTKETIYANVNPSACESRQDEEESREEPKMGSSVQSFRRAHNKRTSPGPPPEL